MTFLDALVCSTDPGQHPWVRFDGAQYTRLCMEHDADLLMMRRALMAGETIRFPGLALRLHHRYLHAKGFFDGTGRRDDTRAHAPG